MDDDASLSPVAAQPLLYLKDTYHAGKLAMIVLKFP
jgi:hypothetical protein